MRKLFWILLFMPMTLDSLFAQYEGLDSVKINTTEMTMPSHKTDTVHKKHPLNPHPPISYRNFYQKEAMTFYCGFGSPTLVNMIDKGLLNSLKPTYPKMGKSSIKNPKMLGYQYHFRERWSMGLVYSWAQVKTDTINYPDYDNPGDYSTFRYVVNLGAFMGSLDYIWKLRRGKKSTLALFSGIALGNSHINYEAKREPSDKGNSYIPTFNNGISASGVQITAIAIKHTFKGLRKFGYQASLGGGVNSIGFSWGINYTL